MLAAMVVAASLGGSKKGDADELWRYVFVSSRLLAFSLGDPTSAGCRHNTRPIPWLRISVPKNFCSMNVLRSFQFLLEQSSWFRMDGNMIPFVACPRHS
jgi:hypothetical protein